MFRVRMISKQQQTCHFQDASIAQPQSFLTPTWTNTLRPFTKSYQGVSIGCGNSSIFYFHLPNWGNDPIWRAYFSNGWFNHQLGVNELFLCAIFAHNFLLFVGSLEAQKLMENYWGLVLPSLWPMPAMKRPFGEATNLWEYLLNA